MDRKGSGEMGDASWRKDGRNRLRACGAGSVSVGK